MGSYNLFERDCTTNVKIEAMSAIIGGFLLILYTLRSFRSFKSTVYPIHILQKQQKGFQKQKQNKMRSSHTTDLSPVVPSPRRLKKTDVKPLTKQIDISCISIDNSQSNSPEKEIMNSPPYRMNVNNDDSNHKHINNQEINNNLNNNNNNNVNNRNNLNDNNINKKMINKKSRRGKKSRRAQSFDGGSHRLLVNNIRKPRKYKRVTMLPVLRRLALPISLCIFFRGWMRFLGVRHKEIFVLYYIFNFYAGMLLSMAACVVTYYVQTVMIKARLYNNKLKPKYAIIAAVFSLTYPLVCIIWGAIIDRDWPLWIYVLMIATLAPTGIGLSYRSLTSLLKVLEEQNMMQSSGLLLWTIHIAKIYIIIAIPWGSAAIYSSINGLINEREETMFLHDNQPEDQKLFSNVLLFFTMLGQGVFIQYLSKARSIHDFRSPSSQQAN